jgi:5-(carboxyamino)imidazole ribonucleotide mutase
VSEPGTPIGILVGSDSDRARMQAALDVLDEQGVGYEFEVRSAHRTPDAVAEYARTARDRGLRVLICGAGLSAALPGVVAAHTDLPVIGVPLRSSLSVLDGLDALLAISQMPPGVPVATVGVDNARNAAVLALRILNVLYSAARMFVSVAGTWAASRPTRVASARTSVLCASRGFMPWFRDVRVVSTPANWTGRWYRCRAMCASSAHCFAMAWL